MNKIESYFLQHNKIKFSNVICSQHNKKIILRNPKKAQQAVKKEEKDINKGMESMKEIKNEELKKIYSEVEKCMKCEALCNSRLNVVFGRGDEEPDIVFVGEAPGADEDKQGLPFVGRGGKLLDKWIEKMNINKEKYYIMNALKCRPPENRDPLPEEKANCRDFFVRQLQILNPKIICALGRHGFGNLIDFDLKTPFGKARNKVHYYSNNGKDVPVITTYHPAYILRNQKEEDKVISDLEFMLGELEKVRNK
ncbi:uracil-DNA glycosylase [Brachyspira innocens]|uniref:Type-4 uracil-DNA glycosylase n=1 Tax=Brachyspira innocens TaxID=13264 RepID=A0ABT8Z085_9SPIR|nr:uracil-DNA glycosylase [Brachyspira innocens]MDO6993201.1 uracil-DNA glycosylase [Brachyspira innocens]MDO7021551.1 uracil-DNA glycosylase [Brachyspira innocens]